MERREDQGQKWEAFGPRGRYKGSVMGEKGVTALRALGQRGDAGSQRLVKARVAPGAGRGQPDREALAIPQKVQLWLNWGWEGSGVDAE